MGDIPGTVPNMILYVMENIFQESSICEMGISFLEDGRAFSYDFLYETKKAEYPYEKFSEVIRNQYGNEKLIRHIYVVILIPDVVDCYQRRTSTIEHENSGHGKTRDGQGSFLCGLNHLPEEVMDGLFMSGISERGSEKRKRKQGAGPGVFPGEVREP